MKIALHTPTKRYGGIDVAVASVNRQLLKPDVWYIGDDLMRDQWMDADIDEVIVYTQESGRTRNLVATMNKALEFARRDDVDLLVMMQDYIWLPEDGIAKFAELHEEWQGGALLTGLLDKTEPVGDIVDPTGEYTVWQNPFVEKPSGVTWSDVRYRGTEYSFSTTPIEWEINWCAIPRTVFSQYNFDEIYDDGLGHDNQDYAFKAREDGFRIVCDPTNKALGIPHETMFPHEVEEDTPLRSRNQEIMIERWADKL